MSSTTSTSSGQPGAAAPQQENLKMKGWQITEYSDDIANYKFSGNIDVPTIEDPYGVMVKVLAASINPIDNAMIRGYGDSYFDRPFPITVGRDFSGIVVGKGPLAGDAINVGDEVWGVIPLSEPGSHAEYACTHVNNLTHKPKSLGSVEAASILYAGVTAWSGLFLSGKLDSFAGIEGIKVCVLGASGGVGSIAVQIAKAENAEVVAVCSTSGIPLVEKLGADHIVDYTKEDAEQQLASLGPYNIILDCAARGRAYAGQTLAKYDQYITFSTPFLRNFDTYGYIYGYVKTACTLLFDNVWSLVTRRALIKWAFFTPAPEAIRYLTKLVETKKLTPSVDSTYNFGQVQEAFQRLRSGHVRGKVVINIEDKDSETS